MSGNTRQDWWQSKALGRTRRARVTPSRAACAKPGDAFLIVTEGKVTERVYFEQLRASLQLAPVRIRSGRTSDPRDVIKTAAAEVLELGRRKRKNRNSLSEVSSYDHVWAVVDTDAAVRDGIWPEVLALASNHKVKLAATTPCFEYWLLLHVVGYTTRSLTDGAAAKRVLEEALGCDYSTNVDTAREVMAGLIGKWPEAVEHAQKVRRYHLSLNNLSPANPSTGVDELVCALNDAAAQHNRKLRS